MAAPPVVSVGCWTKPPLFAAAALTVNVLLVPVAPPCVAVSVLPVPAWVTVTLWVWTPLSPATNVTLVGAIVPAVVLRFTTPVKPVTVLLLASWAVMAMLNGVPAACGLLIVPIANLFSAPAFTVNALLVPVFPEFAAGGGTLPVCGGVPLGGPAAPAVNATVVTGAPTSAPVDVSVAVPVKSVFVLLFASRAVIRRLNAVPAVCVAIAPPPVFSTRKLSSAPGVTVNALLVPVFPEFAAVIVKLPVFVI